MGESKPYSVTTILYINPYAVEIIHNLYIEYMNENQVGRRPMTRRRSKLEIYLDVLWIIKNGTRKPTRIMYGANLSWKPLQRILRSMVSQELIREIDASDNRDKRTNTYYEITQKGENVVKYFNRAKDLIELEEVAKIRW